MPVADQTCPGAFDLFPIGNPGLDAQNNTSAALACLNLSVEVPTTAAYVICVSVAGPALIGLGLPPLLAHLFVFWFALLSTITPPVCGAVFIAAGMVQVPWGRVAVTAMALGIGLYIVPLAMVANPALIGLAESPWIALATGGQVAVGLSLVAHAVAAPWPAMRRLALLVAGGAVIFLPSLLSG